MPRVLRYDRQVQRVWLCGARIHHGIVGAALVVAGLYLMWDDRHDCPWLRDNI